MKIGNLEKKFKEMGVKINIKLPEEVMFQTIKHLDLLEQNNMGILNKIIDNFKSNEFSVSGNKKLRTINKEFNNSFNLSLLIYKGNQRADESLSFAELKKTSVEIDTSLNNIDLKIKASMTINEVENLFYNSFGVKVQIGDIKGKIISSKFGNLTLGEASRNEYL